MEQSVQLTERRAITQVAEFSDAHCHMNLFKEPTKVIEQARKNGVVLIISAGGSAKDNAECVHVAEANAIFTVVGVSPDYVLMDADHVKELKAMVKNSKSIIGIGEIGLDAKVDISLTLQKSVFREQLEIAKELDLPVVLHTRGTLEETAKVLEEEKVKRALFHFFSGDEKLAKHLEQKGYLISIPPVIGKGREAVIKEVGLDNLVTETDAPIVGKTPSDVAGVCKRIAELKGVSTSEAAEEMTSNLRNFFYI